MNGEHSISRNDSVSSRGSVRITITNLAETNGNVQDLDSPGKFYFLFSVNSKFHSIFYFGIHFCQLFLVTQFLSYFPISTDKMLFIGCIEDDFMVHFASYHLFRENQEVSVFFTNHRLISKFNNRFPKDKAENSKVSVFRVLKSPTKITL